MIGQPAETHITGVCDKNVEKTTLQYEECPFDSDECKYICKFTAKGCILCGFNVFGLLLLVVYYIGGIIIRLYCSK